MRQALVNHVVLSDEYKNYVQIIRDLYVAFAAHPLFPKIETLFSIDNDLWKDIQLNIIDQLKIVGENAKVTQQIVENGQTKTVLYLPIINPAPLRDENEDESEGDEPNDEPVPESAGQRVMEDEGDHVRTKFY